MSLYVTRMLDFVESHIDDTREWITFEGGTLAGFTLPTGKKTPAVQYWWNRAGDATSEDDYVRSMYELRRAVLTDVGQGPPSNVPDEDYELLTAARHGVSVERISQEFGIPIGEVPDRTQAALEKVREEQIEHSYEIPSGLSAEPVEA